eukprot:1158473-Pelagomonas_calceolata.AAC.8
MKCGAYSQRLMPPKDSENNLVGSKGAFIDSQHWSAHCPLTGIGNYNKWCSAIGFALRFESRKHCSDSATF